MRAFVTKLFFLTQERKKKYSLLSVGLVKQNLYSAAVLHVFNLVFNQRKYCKFIIEFPIDASTNSHEETRFSPKSHFLKCIVS